MSQATRRAIDRGQRLREVLKQPQYQPLPAAEQIAVLLAVTQGLFDAVPLEQIGEAARAARAAVTTRCAEIGQRIAAGSNLNEEDREVLLAAVRVAVASFTANASIQSPSPPAKGERVGVRG